METRQILIDWGTTNARAWLVDGNGVVLDRNAAPLGIRLIESQGFEDALVSLNKDWPFDPDTPVLMSGMIGSRQGWQEIPYVDCPVSLEDLHHGIREVRSAPNIKIVPGVHWQLPNDVHDVMRGEEVQIFGALTDVSADSGPLLFCLPGTHAKWAVVEKNRLVQFATSLTGEAFSALADHTILRALMPDQDNVSYTARQSGFSEGLQRSRQSGGLLNHLFSVRAQPLFDEIPADSVHGYLSGVLIGHEVSDMLKMFDEHRQIIVVGEGDLARHYVDAITAHDVAASLISAEKATLDGLMRLASWSSK